MSKFNMQAYQASKSQKFELRRQFTGRWTVEMCDAPCANPGCCIGSVLCPHVASFLLRKQALNNDFSRYTCCQGYSCQPADCFYESNCPELCLCVETCLCFPNSVMATRYYIQDQMVVQNSECDDTLIGITVALQQLSCICDCAASLSGNEDLREIAAVVHCVADQVYCSVCACMQTQHKMQMDARDKGEYQVPMAPMLAPGVQMMEMGMVAGQQPIQYPQYAQGPAPGYPPPAPGQYPPQPPAGAYYVQGAPLPPQQGPPPGAVGYPYPQQQPVAYYASPAQPMPPQMGLPPTYTPQHVQPGRYPPGAQL